LFLTQQDLFIQLALGDIFLEHGHNLRGYSDNAIKNQMKELHIMWAGLTYAFWAYS
jgi:hypothetical protein